jgi:predicted O-methyltransferase YrrM
MGLQRIIQTGVDCDSLTNMAIKSKLRNWVNKGLALADLRLETRRAERAEIDRLLNLERTGHFHRQIFPVLPQISRCNPSPLLEALERYQNRTSRFAKVSEEGAYSFSNDYFTSPDAEVAYALVRLLRPKRIIEVGSGNSTHLFREAITDGELNTKLVSVDPSPRREIESVANEVIRRRLEDVPPSDLQDVLQTDDILFIDSSHEIRSGNDVVTLFLNVLPNLGIGVVIHIHDIFLPFEYPREWIIRNSLNVNWAEQYLVQAMLQGSDRFEVLWPGHFLQRTLPRFSDHFHYDREGIAKSFWLRKIN